MDRLQIIVVAKKYIDLRVVTVYQTMPKMCAIPQLVSAPFISWLLDFRRPCILFRIYLLIL